MTYDLVIRNGAVVDGTGLPRRRADVAVKDGRIAAVGFLAEGTRRPGHRRRRAGRRPRHRRPPHPLRPPAHLRALRHRRASTASPPSSPATAASASPRCGPATRPWLIQLFARVEGTDPTALEGIPVDGLRVVPRVPRLHQGEDRHQRRLLRGPLRRAPLRHAATTARPARPRPREIAQMAAHRAARPCTPAPPASPRTHSPTHFDSADRPVPRRLSSTEELRALVAEAGRANGGSDRLPPRLGRRRHHARRRGAAHRPVAAPPHAGDHPGPRRPLEGRRPTAGWDNANAVRRRGHRPGRRRLLDGDVEAVQPHLRPRRRHQALRGRPRSSTAIFTEAAHRRPSGLALLGDRRSATPIRDSVDHPNRDPRRQPDAAAARPGTCCTSARSHPGNDK